MTSFRDQLLQTAKSALDKYGDLTPESVVAHRSADCVHRLLPASAGVPDRTNREYADFVMELKKTVPNMRLVVQEKGQGSGDGFFEPMVDEAARRVLVHVKAAGDTPYGPCEAEYFMALRMSEDGTQIVEFVEFVDTAYTLEFIRKAALKV